MFDELIHMHTDLLQAGKTDDVECEGCRSGLDGMWISIMRDVKVSRIYTSLPSSDSWPF
jgi:hypothetical protein